MYFYLNWTRSKQ